MINYVKGDDVFALNVNDVVYVKAVVNGYFGVVREIRKVTYHYSDKSYVIREIVIHRPHHDDDKEFVVNDNCNIDRYADITKIPKDLFGSMILYKEKLYTVLYFDISKTFPLKIENIKTKYSEWIGASDFIHVNWRKDDVENVRIAETFKEFQNKTYDEMTRDVKIISMCYRSDFENLENGDRIVFKENLCLNGGPRRYSLAYVTCNHKDCISFKLTDRTFSYSIKTLKNGNCLKCGFLKIPSNIKVGNTLWYNGNPAIVIKTPVLMHNDYMFSIEVFETAIEHHEVPVNAENYHKCVWNNTDNKLKEAEKAFKGAGLNMDIRTIRDILKQDRDMFIKAVDKNQIIITTDGVKVTYARCGDLVASSRCHDDDKFDAWTGAKIALERLEKKFVEKAEREKKEKLLNNWYDSLTEEKKEFVKKKLQEEK